MTGTPGSNPCGVCFALCGHSPVDVYLAVRQTVIKTPTRLIALLLTLVITGCSATNVTVKGDFPTPLSHPLPVHGGLVLDDAFREHVYQDSENRKLTFAVGEAQTAMMRSLSKGLFRQVTELSDIDQRNGQQLLLAPVVEEVQVAMPFENRLKVFEVWLKYNIRVYDQRGEPVADWIMSAYGKTPSRFLTSDEEALNQAAVVALRDAGARLLLEFHRIPEVQALLQTAGTGGKTP